MVLPFSRKLRPAAFPVFTTISWVARTEVCAGAISVSLETTGSPSAMSETQVVSSARICKVKVMGGFAAAVRAAACGAGCSVFDWGASAAGLLAEPADVTEDAAEDTWFAGEVCGVEAGAGD